MERLDLTNNKKINNQIEQFKQDRETIKSSKDLYFVTKELDRIDTMINAYLKACLDTGVISYADRKVIKHYIYVGGRNED